jgi:hypothetical protein
MPSPSVGDTTVADFSAGTPDSGTAVAAIGDGDVILAPSVNQEFGGSSLPAGWSSNAFAAGGAASVSGAASSSMAPTAATDAHLRPGHALDFVATFGAAHFQHVGFVNALAFDGDWIIISTKDTSDSSLRAHERRASSRSSRAPG